MKKLWKYFDVRRWFFTVGQTKKHTTKIKCLPLAKKHTAKSNFTVSGSPISRHIPNSPCDRLLPWVLVVPRSTKWFSVSTRENPHKKQGSLQTTIFTSWKSACYRDVSGVRTKTKTMAHRLMFSWSCQYNATNIFPFSYYETKSEKKKLWSCL
jgi:hypothetical protein